MANLQKHKHLAERANKITKRKTLYAAGAGLIPIPIVDAATLLGVQLTMIRDIGDLYGIPFKKHRVKSLISALLGSTASVGLVKAIPGVGTLVGSLTASISGAAATYALGKVFTQHFDQGGTLLDFDPISTREYFQKEYEEGHLFVSQQDLVENTAEVTENSVTTKTELYAETERLEQQLAQLQEEISQLQQSKTNFTPDTVVDFTIIEGIGPKTDEVLRKAGVHSLEALAAIKVGRIKEILKEAAGNFNLLNPDTWPEQARLAAAGQLKELEKLQDRLVGGKEKK